MAAVSSAVPSLDSRTPCPPSLSRAALRRQSSKVGAVCVDAHVRICAGLCQECAKAQCCTRDEGGPFDAGLQEQASNSRKLLPPHGGGGERSGKGATRSRHVWVRETNASEPLMRPRNRSTEGIKTGAPPLSGKSMAETCVLAMWCPGYRWRDSSLGSGAELENLIGGGKGKGTSGSPARPKVPIRRAGTDCPVVALKRSNVRGAKGAGHSRHGQVWSTGNGRNQVVVAEGGSPHWMARAV
jgi:hypothetical protein